MTRFLLIRHGNTDALGQQISGRMPGVHLDAEGRRQAAELPERLGSERVSRILVSPLERTRATAQPLADRLALPMEPHEELLELDFGDWTGARFRDLEDQPRWREFNSFRSGTRIPEGELMLETQTRIVGLLLDVAEASPHACIAVFTHGDVIKSAVTYLLGMPIDFFSRIEISPASISVIEVDRSGPRLMSLNQT